MAGGGAPPRTPPPPLYRYYVMCTYLLYVCILGRNKSSFVLQNVKFNFTNLEYTQTTILDTLSQDDACHATEAERPGVQSDVKRQII